MHKQLKFRWPRADSSCMDTLIDTTYQSQLTDAASRNDDAVEADYESTMLATKYSPTTADQLGLLARSNTTFAAEIRKVTPPSSEIALVQERVAASMDNYAKLLQETADSEDVADLTQPEVEAISDGSPEFQELCAAADEFKALGYSLDSPDA